MIDRSISPPRRLNTIRPQSIRQISIGAALGAGLLVGSAAAQIYTPPLAFESPPRVYCTVVDPTPEDNTCQDSRPNGVDIADIIGLPNGSHPDVPDGFPEVAVCNTYKGSVTVFRNTRDWTLPSSPTNGLVIDGIYDIQNGAGAPDTNAKPYDLQFVNMQMDPGSNAVEPFMDIVVSVQRPQDSGILLEAINILWNDGNGRFDVIPQTRIELHPTFHTALGLYVADVDADGKFDIMVAGHSDPGPAGNASFPQVEVLRWQGAAYGVDHYNINGIGVDYDPLFLGRATDIVAAPVRLPQIAGRLDFLVSMVLTGGPGSPGDRMGVFLNDGDTDANGFPNWTKLYHPAVSSEGVVFGKLRSNPEPPQDAVLATASSINQTFNNKAFVEQGNGLGLFTQVIDGYPLTTLFNPFGLDLGKLSPDQNNDVVIACRAGRPPLGCDGVDHKGGVAVLLGQADGTFHSTIKYFASDLYCHVPPRDPLPTFVRIGDLNNDNQNDIVAANNSSGSIGVLINSTLMPIE